MSTDFGRAYDVLGVKPGVSDRELKAAHRDLAKVWHPDRFLHDPRLQEKAQEKLKEINEAYEQLLTRNTRRHAPPPPPRRSYSTSSANVTSIRPRRGVGWHWYVAGPLVVFAMVFAVTTRSLVRDRAPQPLGSTEVATTTEEPAQTTSQPDTNHTVRNRADNNLAPTAETETEPAPANEVVPAVPTVTVAIDPATGLLATPACPVKTRMTYPSGSEPKGHCPLTHITKPEKETGIKGLAKRIL